MNDAADIFAHERPSATRSTALDLATGAISDVTPNEALNMLKLSNTIPEVIRDLDFHEARTGADIGRQALAVLTELDAAGDPSTDKDTLAQALHSPYSSVRAAAARNPGARNLT